MLLYFLAAVLLYILYFELKQENEQVQEIKTGIPDTTLTQGTIDTVEQTIKKRVKGVMHPRAEGIYRDSVRENEVSGELSVTQQGDSILYDLVLDLKSYMFHKTDTLKITRIDTVIYHHTPDDESFFTSFEGGVITTAGILLAALLLILGLN